MIMLYRYRREAPESCRIITFSRIRTGIVVNPIAEPAVSYLSTPSQFIHQIPARGFRHYWFYNNICEILAYLQCNTVCN